MKTNEIENVVRFTHMINDVNKLSTYSIARHYQELVKLSKMLTTIDVHTCNGTKYTDDESYLKATKSVYDKLNAILPELGIDWYHQTDPRGGALYISNVEPLTAHNYTSGLNIY